MTSPAVSVIMPFLNMERFIGEAIESVLAQTFRDWELLLIDDGSTDDSTQIARTIAARHPDRVRYLEHPGHRNLGASASRNLGLAQARGRYIALLDADDIWLAHKLEDQLVLLRQHTDIDLLYGCTEYWYSWTGKKEDRNKDYVQSVGLETNRSYPPASLYRRLFISPDITTPCTCSLLIRRELIDQVGGFEDAFRKVFTDQVFYAKLFLFGRAFVADAVWDRYRQHPDSACHIAEQTGQLVVARRDFLEWLQKYFASLGITGTLARQLDRALWAHDHPRLARLIDLPRRSKSRFERGLGRPRNPVIRLFRLLKRVGNDTGRLKKKS